LHATTASYAVDENEFGDRIDLLDLAGREHRLVRQHQAEYSGYAMPFHALCQHTRDRADISLLPALERPAKQCPCQTSGARSASDGTNQEESNRRDAVQEVCATAADGVIARSQSDIADQADAEPSNGEQRQGE